MSIKNGQSLKFWLTFGSVGGSLMLLNACSGDDNQAPQIVITPAPITAVTPRPTSTLGSTPIPVPTSFSPTATPTPGFSFTPTPAASLAPTTGNPTVAVTAPSVVFQSATTTVLGIVAAPAGLVGGNAFKVDVQTPISLSYVYPASAVGCATAATNCVASVPVLIPSTVPVGNYTLTLSVMDSQTRIATASQTISVIVNPLPSPSPAPSPSPTPVPSPTPSVSPSPVASPSPSPSPSRTPSP